jgi:hypothetical protein
MFDSVPIGGIAQKFPQFDAPKRIYSSPVIQAKNFKELSMFCFTASLRPFSTFNAL